MSNIISIHSKNPQVRKINQVKDVLLSGGVVVYPTDSGYALGCLPGFKSALQRIRRIRDLDKRHLFTLLCPHISMVAQFSVMSTPAFRLIKRHTPGPYTFILLASKDVPKTLLPHKQNTIGIRLPSHPVMLSLLEELDTPLLNVSLVLPTSNDDTSGDEEFSVPLVAASNIEEVEDLLLDSVDMIIDSGFCLAEATSIIDLSQDEPVVLRQGQGDVSQFL